MNITVNIEEADLKRNLFHDEHLKELLANKLYKEFIDSSWNEIKSEFTEIARQVIREVVKDYVKNYYENNNIKKDVERVFKDLTKDDLLKLLGATLTSPGENGASQ